jgi:hypothetical protein
MILGSRKQSKKSPWKSRFGNGITRKCSLCLQVLKFRILRRGLGLLWLIHTNADEDSGNEI